MERLTAVIKAANIEVGPPRMVPVSPLISVAPAVPLVLEQAQQVASAAWERTNPAQLFYENNVRLLSIMPIFSPQPAPYQTVLGPAPYQTVLGPELNAANAVSEAESILAAAARPKLGTVEVPPVLFQTGIFPKPEIQTEGVVVSQIRPQPQIESNTTIQYVTVPTVQEQIVEEKIQGPVEIVKEDEEIQNEEAERVNELKIQRVVDEAAAKQRVSEIIEAAIKARSLDGKDIVQFLPGQHMKNRSGELNIVDPQGRLIDGSLLATFKKIVTSFFTSFIDLVKRVPKIVRENVPVTQGGGKAVADQDVWKVYEPNKRKAPPALQVIRRVVKVLKQVKLVKIGQQPIQVVPYDEQVSETNEGTIADLGLEQVLTDSKTLG